MKVFYLKKDLLEKGIICCTRTPTDTKLTARDNEFIYVANDLPLFLILEDGIVRTQTPHELIKKGHYTLAEHEYFDGVKVKNKPEKPKNMLSPIWDNKTNVYKEGADSETLEKYYFTDGEFKQKGEPSADLIKPTWDDESNKWKETASKKEIKAKIFEINKIFYNKLLSAYAPFSSAVALGLESDSQVEEIRQFIKDNEPTETKKDNVIHPALAKYFNE